MVNLRKETPKSPWSIPIYPELYKLLILIFNMETFYSMFYSMLSVQTHISKHIIFAINILSSGYIYE